jgi:large subunit ribosomal protein L33
LWFGGSAERRGFLLFFFEVVVFILIIEYVLKSAVAAALLGFSRSSTDFIILECTEARAEGKPVSRYISSRNKKSPNTPNRLEKVKYNPFLRRRTVHRETK